MSDVDDDKQAWWKSMKDAGADEFKQFKADIAAAPQIPFGIEIHNQADEWRITALEAENAQLRTERDSDEWEGDPSSDERWNAGVDFAQQQLCNVLGVDPKTVNWDAGTETLDGDVQSVIGGILRLSYGDDWTPVEVNRLKTERDGARAAALKEAAEWHSKQIEEISRLLRHGNANSDGEIQMVMERIFHGTSRDALLALADMPQPKEPQ